MPEVYVPFESSQNEGIDPKLLPSGVLSSLRNMRLRKDGRLQLRYGYDYDGTVTPPSNIIHSFTAGPQSSLVVYQSGALTYAKRKVPGWLTAPTTALFKTALMGQFAGVTRAPCSRLIHDELTSFDCIGVNETAEGALVVAAWCDGDDASVIISDLPFVYLRVFDRSGNVLSTTRIPEAYQPHLVSYGSMCGCIVRSDVDGVTNTLYVLNTTTLAWSSQAFAIPFSAAAATPLDAVAANADTLFIVSDTGLYRYVISTSVVTNFSGWLAIASQFSIGLSGNGNIIWTEVTAGGVWYEEWTQAGVAVGGAQIFLAAGTLTAVGPAPVCPNAAPGWFSVFAIADSVAGNAQYTAVYSSSAAAYVTYPQVSPQSRPFVAPAGQAGGNEYFVWVADTNVKMRLPGAPRPSLRLLGIGNGINGVLVYGTLGVLHSEVVAMPQDVQSTGADDCRRSVAVLRSVGTNPGRIVHQQQAWASERSDTVWLDYGTWANGQASVVSAGHLFVAGARLWEYDGSETYPAGLEKGPPWIAAIDSGAGAGVDAGTHQYVAVWQCIDNAGSLHRSPPSPVVSVTLGVARDVGVTLGETASGQVLPMPEFAASRVPSVEVYRTTAGGTVFYLAATIAPWLGSLTDSMSDATLAAQPILYTQGQRGGLSGLLPNEEPPACRFIWAGNSRFIIGGLEDPISVQFSKLFYPDEAVTWSSLAAYRVQLPEAVTGVACLDGTWIVFTASSTWEIVGDGPDDSGGAGVFSEPRKRPGDTGCISQRSIVECSQGLLFQGTNGSIWLLPRGGNAAVWIGQPVRDTLASYPIVRAAKFVEAEDCVYWALASSAGTTGVLLVYDLRNSQWYVDTYYTRVIHSLGEFNGALLIDGVILQTPGVYVDDDTGAKTTAIAGEIVTGDIRPFGAAGWGRCRLFGVLGEYRSACTLAAYVSYDSGGAWTDSYSWALTGTAGSTFDREFGPSRMRGCDYRVKLTITPSPAGDGAALNALSIEVYQQAGVRRLAAAHRG